jgi:hypothetical protein
MEVKHPKFFEIFDKYGGYKDNKFHVKLKKPKQLQEVLDIARYLISEIDQNPDPEIEENKSKLEQLKSVVSICSLIIVILCPQLIAFNARLLLSISTRQTLHSVIHLYLH